MDKAQLLELIKKVPFFKNLTDNEKSLLVSTNCSVLKYYPNQRIISEGEFDNCLFVLLYGDVIVTKNIPSHEGTDSPSQAMLAKLSPGALFGEIALISKHPRTSNVTAVGETVVIKISRKDMEMLPPLLSNKIQSMLIELLVKRLESLNAKMSELAK